MKIHLIVLVIVAIVALVVLVAMLMAPDILPFSPCPINMERDIDSIVTRGRVYVNGSYCGVLVQSGCNVRQDTIEFYSYVPLNHNGYTILHSHCNKGDMVDNSHVILFARRYGFALIGYDYRGFGGSSYPTQLKNIKEDCWAMYCYITSIVSPDKILLWGESLGSIPSTLLASQSFLLEQWQEQDREQIYRTDPKLQPYARTFWAKEPLPPLCLISISSALVSRDTMKYRKTLNQWGSMIISTLMRQSFHNFNCTDHIASIKCPCIFIHSVHDELFPHDEIQDILSSIKAPKILISTTGTHGHPTISEEEGDRISQFLHRQNIIYISARELCEMFVTMNAYRSE